MIAIPDALSGTATDLAYIGSTISAAQAAAAAQTTGLELIHAGNIRRDFAQRRSVLPSPERPRGAYGRCTVSLCPC